MVSVPFIPLFSPFLSLKNSLDAERSHTSFVLGSVMRCLFSIMLTVVVFRMALMYSLVAVYDKGYILLWLGVYIVLNSLLIMLACTNIAFNCVEYMCLLGCCLQRFVWIVGIISSRTTSTLEASTALRNSTLGGGYLNFESLVMLGLSDVGSDVFCCCCIREYCI